MAAKIRRNDEVIILAGKDKGKTGKVTKVLATPEAGSGNGCSRRYR